MADTHDEPTEDEARRFAEWKEKMGISLACPACGHEGWSLHQSVALPILSSNSKLPGEYRQLQVAAARLVSCDRCGYLAMFAAVPSGGDAGD
jgi:DNA-directed RNA polymerase subunit RPC12/RpoP